ncbi:hypothetical protein SCOCK_220010 [Actinacidiphila cocklensis]|uniref:Uncharacterized protein n=1 Tax=Actinacidiphila cocklensis TaxID=887465 RepID=A0A9W4E672_9ACTN|nr:hypothetical protein SCOCK_220010 [Actinacidiphila cocklensis]
MGRHRPQRPRQNRLGHLHSTVSLICRVLRTTETSRPGLAGFEPWTNSATPPPGWNAGGTRSPARWPP